MEFFLRAGSGATAMVVSGSGECGQRGVAGCFLGYELDALFGGIQFGGADLAELQSLLHTEAEVARGQLPDSISSTIFSSRFIAVSNGMSVDSFFAAMRDNTSATIRPAKGLLFDLLPSAPAVAVGDKETLVVQGKWDAGLQGNSLRLGLRRIKDAHSLYSPLKISAMNLAFPVMGRIKPHDRTTQFLVVIVLDELVDRRRQPQAPTVRIPAHGPTPMSEHRISCGWVHLPKIPM